MARRRRREKKAAQPEYTAPAQDAYTDLKTELDQALQALPDKYRKALLLCYFEDRTLEEAASELGCPRGTVASRLAHGRELLRRRLARHGLPTAALTTFLLAESASTAGAPALVKTTVTAGVQVAAGIAVENVVPASVAPWFTPDCEARLCPKRWLCWRCWSWASPELRAWPDWPARAIPMRRRRAPALWNPPPQPPLKINRGRNSSGDPLPDRRNFRESATCAFGMAITSKHLVFTRDSTMLISSDYSGTRVWEAANRKEICHITHETIYAACDASMDSKFVALFPASQPNNIVHLHDIKTGRHLRDIKQMEADSHGSLRAWRNRTAHNRR